MLKFLGLVTLVAVASAAEFSRRLAQDDQWSPSGRIVGGENTTIEAFPYQVGLLKDGFHRGGGSIIAKHWVITACPAIDSELSAYTIIAGTNNRFKGGSRHTVESIVCHEKFEVTSVGTLVNNVALIRVKEAFIFDATRQPISMFSKHENIPDKAMGVITGWGKAIDHEDEYHTEILQALNLPIVAKDICNKTHEFLGGIPADEICAGYLEGGKGMCLGDGGGPLAVEGRLAGISSWSVGCAEPGFPGVYTEVAAYRDWIKANSGV